MTKSNYPIQDFIFKHFPWTSVFYAKRRHPEFRLISLAKMWVEAKPPTDRQRDSAAKVLYGDGKITRAEQFFYLLALRNYRKEADE